jgi:arylsulfatase A-like enzyme
VYNPGKFYVWEELMKQQVLNRIFRIFLFVFLIYTISCGGGKPSDDQKMNVLLFTLDTLRADHLGCYGYTKNTSPTLDALASTSIVFDNAIAQSAITPVSHASIMTGLYPYNHDLRSLHGGVNYQLPDSRLTLAELMEANGYATGGFVSAFPVTEHYGLHQGFETWDEDFQKEDEIKVLTEQGIVNTGTAQRACNITTEKALSWLRNKADTPFFAWIHYFDVHDPILLPPDAYLKRFYPKSRDKPDILRAVYDAEIAFMDDQIDRIVKELEALNIRENTILVILSDHGEGLGDHDWWGHSILYQEQIRLVFLLSIPGRGEGVRVPSLVRSIDLVPTLIELLSLYIPAENDFDGKSLLEMIDKPDTQPRIAYSESINDLTAYYDSQMQDESLYAISDGRWKLILHREKSNDKDVELYDLQADPHELTDLSEKHPEIIAQMRDQLDKMPAIVQDPPRPTMDEKTKERLKSLGYIK